MMSAVDQTLLAFVQARELCQGWKVPRTIHAIFIPGRAEGDYEPGEYDVGLLKTATDLDRTLNLQSVRYIIPGHDGSYRDGKRMEHGYLGFATWRASLMKHYPPLPLTEILPCVIRRGREQVTHTREETDGFILRMKELQYHTAAVIAHPHQIVRVMACILASMKKIDHHCAVIPHLPNYLAWMRPVYGSLGQQQLPRWQHIEQEVLQILDYLEKGYMVPLEELVKYLLRYRQCVERAS